MLIVDIAVDIMDGEVSQRDPAAGSLILCHHSYAGAIHLVRGAVAFPRNPRSTVGNFEIAENHMLHIV